MLQLINITEEKLTANILLALKKELDHLKKEFQPKQPTEWISRKSTAEMLGVSFTTLTNWHKKGVLTAYNIGTRVYYKLDEVHNALTPIAC